MQKEGADLLICELKPANWLSSNFKRLIPLQAKNRALIATSCEIRRALIRRRRLNGGEGKAWFAHESNPSYIYFNQAGFSLCF